jgi:hypothetical protein
MLNIVRRSQILGLAAMDGSTVDYLGDLSEVWLDETGKVAYFSGTDGYVPLEQVADISPTLLSIWCASWEFQGIESWRWGRSPLMG